ncbi:calycin-like domain-containing protein [Prevotella sp.]|uniref:calycin-like domain-containing protein n=1 Tax=Prevotella sp. TaxID=59823 RepID=UPI002600EC2E|nr:calycin-like domain-containing protein [Prevotella sp.]MCI6128802.1 PCMD domain-containing protein [Prevotella sp.]
MKRFLLPAFALALAVNANATSFQANMAAEQQTTVQAAKQITIYKGKLEVIGLGDPTDATITVTEEANGKYSFVLNDFKITAGDTEMLIGDAVVSNLEAKTQGGTITLEATDKDAKVVGGISGQLRDGKVVMTITVTIKNGIMTADISKITVTFINGDALEVAANFTTESVVNYYKSTCQINGGFDETWVDCIPWDSKATNKTVGTRPVDWNISNVCAINAPILGQVTYTVGKSIDNGNGKAVKLTNNEAFGNGIPAYLTLGTPWATAKGTSAANPDGGTFGGKKFTYRPDAISFDYQHSTEKGAENATAIAYMWKGNWTQKNVPATTDAGSGANPQKCIMINRDRNILGNETSATLGDPAEPSNDAKLIAKLEQPISESTNGTWKSMTIPFTYKDDTAIPEYINVIFAANDYFGDRKSIIKGNSLTIDNVKLVYYHALNSLTYNGNKVANFDEGTTEYTLNGKLAEDFDKVEFTVKGVGASYDVAKDEANNVATITVKSNDYDVNPSSKTVYTIKFDGTVGIHGITTSTNTANGAIYDLSGRQLKTMQKGINIVRGKDGKMIKVMK